MADPLDIDATDHPRPAFLPAESDVSDIDLLHTISTELIGERDRVELYGEVVNAAVAIARSQFGTMQLLCPVGAR